MSYYESYQDNIFDVFRWEEKEVLVFSVVMTDSDYKEKRDQFIDKWIASKFTLLSDRIPSTITGDVLEFKVQRKKTKTYTLTKTADGFKGTITWSDDAPRHVTFVKK